jgi:hypothetical protein
VISIYSGQIIKLLIIIIQQRNLLSITIITTIIKFKIIMNRNFSLVFILLAILSIVNAIPFHKRAVTFSKCPLDPPVNPLTVTVAPDPAAGKTSTYTVSGPLDPPAGPGSLLAIGYLDQNGKFIGQPFQMDICATNTCPLSNIETTADVPGPADLPKEFVILVAVGQEGVPPSGCAAGAVGAAGAPAKAVDLKITDFRMSEARFFG